MNMLQILGVILFSSCLYVAVAVPLYVVARHWGDEAPQTKYMGSRDDFFDTATVAAFLWPIIPISGCAFLIAWQRVKDGRKAKAKEERNRREKEVDETLKREGVL